MQIEYSLSEVNGIGHSTEEKLRNAGITSVSQLASMSSENLSKIKGFGLVTAKKLIASAKNFLDINEKVNNKSKSNKIFLDDETLISNELYQEDENKSEKSKFIYNYYSPQDEINQQAFISDERDLDENNKDEIYNFENSQNKEIIYSNSVKNVLEREIQNENLMKNPKKFDNMSSIKKSDNMNYSPIVDENIVRNTIHQTHNIKNTDDMYARFNGEKLDKKKVIEIQQNVMKKFKDQAYYIIPNNTNLLRNINQNFDLLALKIIKINKVKSVILLFPIQICHLRGSLVISEDSIKYKYSDHKNNINNELEDHILKTSIIKFIEVQYELFENISLEKSLFDFIKKLVNNNLSVIKTKKNKPLFIHSGQTQFKIIIDPLFICSSKPLFLEKLILYPYQRENNLHIISIEMTNDVLDYLEKKYILLEKTDDQNSIIKHQNLIHKLYVETRIGSIPFLCFGVLLLFIILFSDIFIIATLTRIGIGALGIYIVFLCFSYLRFFNIQKETTEEFSIPHFKLKRNLDETDLLIIKDEMGTKIVDQLVYECFGRINEFSIINEIEQEKAEDLDLELSDYKENRKLEYMITIRNSESQNGNNSLREKIISKYSEFLE